MLSSWSQWLGEIELEIRDLRAVYEIYREVRKIVRENQSIPSQNVFHRWMRGLYVAFGVAGVARLVDTRKDTRSLVRLLRQIAPKASLLSRERYVATFASQSGMSHVRKSDAERHANRQFDEYVGIRSSCLTREQVQKDIDFLIDRTSKIVRFRHDYLAHLASRPSKRLPTVAELEYCFALLGGYLNKYSMLIRMRTTFPLWRAPADWQAIFRVPWIALRSDRRKKRPARERYWLD
jgi:hypothetical protein